MKQHWAEMRAVRKIGVGVGFLRNPVAPAAACRGGLRPPAGARSAPLQMRLTTAGRQRVSISPTNRLNR